jgi:hypothetical protein
LAGFPEKFGHWNSAWKRFWRLSRSGTFEAFFDALAALSETAHLVQMFVLASLVVPFATLQVGRLAVRSRWDASEFSESLANGSLILLMVLFDDSESPEHHKALEVSKR